MCDFRHHQISRSLNHQINMTKLVRPEGLEPPAYRFEACRSIQLSYGRATVRVYPTGTHCARNRVLHTSHESRLNRLPRSVEHDLQKLQIEPAAELVSDLPNVRDFAEPQLLMQSQAHGVIRRDTGHDDV
jgi:hypothetical protein